MKPSYLPEMLDLAWWTGRRRDAIRTLRYSDLVREGGEVVAIRWRATKHAEQAETVPLAAAAREAVKRVLAQRPGVGDAPLFPSFADPATPINPTACDKWLRKAEELAGVDHQEGGLWHPHRRSWNSKRQHLPVKARMRAGGWKTERVLRESYEQADDALVLEVLEEPRVMVDRSG
jgi:integrase